MRSQLDYYDMAVHDEWQLLKPPAEQTHALAVA